jgi:hypothetical protein
LAVPLVLTTNAIVRNPDHQWNDVEGVQYHYPNQYKNKIVEGEPFIYYRGVHRPDGGRVPAEYFGRGRVGAIRADPATVGQSRPSWFCAIEDYEPFAPPVPARIGEAFFEDIPANMWRNGVRTISQQVFDQIVAAAGATGPGQPALPAQAPPERIEAEDLIVPRARAVSVATAVSSWRRSRRAREIGDWAERAVLEFIRQNLEPRSLVHRAANGETPGWDIDYEDASGELHRVEVKGTVAAAFTTIELTAGELRAARQHGEGYWLYLVAHCLTDHHRIQRVRDPATRLTTGDWTARPSLYTVLLG